MLRIIFVLFIASLCCGVFSARVTEQTFSYIKTAPSEKVAVFYKPGDDANKEALKIQKAIAKSGNLPSTVEFVKCDCSLPINAADVAEAQFTEFPVLFVASMEGGIQKYNGPVEESAFKEYCQINLSPVEDDKVIQFTNEDDLYDIIDRQNKPVFVKFFEQWCTHCKAMKKAFQAASNKFSDHVTFVEVECSKTDENKEFCSKHGVSSYPTIKLITSEEKIPYTADRSLNEFEKFFRQHVVSMGGKSGGGESEQASSPRPAAGSDGKKKLSDILLERIEQLEQRLNQVEHQLAGLQKPTEGSCSPPQDVAHDEL